MSDRKEQLSFAGCGMHRPTRRDCVVLLLRSCGRALSKVNIPDQACSFTVAEPGSRRRKSVSAIIGKQNEERHDWIEHLGAQDRTVTGRWYQRMADLQVSTTDPDATMMLTKDGAYLGYHTHYVVDGGKARIILHALVTPSEVMDNQPMLDLLWHVRFRWKLRPRQITGDTKYGTAENICSDPPRIGHLAK